MDIKQQSNLCVQNNWLHITTSCKIIQTTMVTFKYQIEEAGFILTASKIEPFWRSIFDGISNIVYWSIWNWTLFQLSLVWQI